MTLPRLLLWNVCSITKRKIELSYLLLKFNIQIALITETWLSPSDQFSIPSYRIVRNDRITNTHGGGVAILIHASLDYLVVPPPRFTEPIDSLINHITVKLPFYSLAIGVAYVPPNVVLDTRFINNIISKSSNFVIGGDFNAKHTTWNNSSVNKNGKILYSHLLENPYFLIHPNTHTYLDPPKKPSTLDLFLSNLNANLSCDVIDDVSTQHLPVILTDTGQTHVTPLWHLETDWKSFCKDTNKFVLQYRLESHSDIDSCVSILTSFLHDTYKQNTVFSAPSSNNPNYFKPDYFNDNLLNSYLKCRRRYRHLLQRTGDTSFRKSIKYITHEINKRLKSLRNDSFSQKLKSLHKSDPTFWRSYRILTSRKNIIPPLLRNNSTLSSEKDKANALASSFAEIYDNSNSLNSPFTDSVNLTVANIEQFPLPSSLSDFSITPSAIDTAISSLRNKAPGPDRISAPIIKNVGYKIRLQLYYIFRACILYAYFPDAWKIASVCAILKPGKPRNLTDSYRPISLLSILSKVFEKCIAVYLRNFLNDNNILINQQFGFRQYHSTTHQLIRVAQIITHEYNVNRSSALVLLDLAKAFDSVWHNGLIHKLYTLKFPISFLRLIKSYLLNRFFFCNINGSHSDSFIIPAGVPQGSILGPILFNIYINDIPIVSNCQLALYADDTIIISSSTQPLFLVRKIQIYLDRVSSFFSDWKLTLNVTKTEALPILRRSKNFNLNTLPKLSINGQPISWSSKVKYLGVIFDHRLSWTPAVLDRIDKTHKAIAASSSLLNHKSCYTRNLKLTLYKVCIRTVLIYGAHVWLSAPHSTLHRLRILQNKVLKIILNKPFRTPTSEVLKEADIQYISSYLADLIKSYNVTNHPNPLICMTGNYHTVPYKRVLKKFPLH